jgi:hypothetical protein
MTRPVGFDGPFGFEEPAQPVDAPHRGAPDAVMRSDPAGRESALHSPWCAERHRYQGPPAPPQSGYARALTPMPYLGG